MPLRIKIFISRKHLSPNVIFTRFPRSLAWSWVQSKEYMHCFSSPLQLSTKRVNLPSTGNEKWAIFDSLSFHQFSRFFQNLRDSSISTSLPLTYWKINILGIRNEYYGRSNTTRFFSATRYILNLYCRVLTTDL